MSELVAKCPQCGVAFPGVEKPGDKLCVCVEAALPMMEFHRADVVGRRIIYLEAMVAALLKREENRVQVALQTGSSNTGQHRGSGKRGKRDTDTRNKTNS